MCRGGGAAVRHAAAPGRRVVASTPGGVAPGLSAPVRWPSPTARLTARVSLCVAPLAGGIKRWGFARGNMTHGSKSKREHGSTGPGSTPGRVFPGLKAAGQMGNVRAKLRKVEVRPAPYAGVTRLRRARALLQRWKLNECMTQASLLLRPWPAAPVAGTPVLC